MQSCKMISRHSCFLKRPNIHVFPLKRKSKALREISVVLLAVGGYTVGVAHSAHKSQEKDSKSQK